MFYFQTKLESKYIGSPLNTPLRFRPKDFGIFRTTNRKDAKTHRTKIKDTEINSWSLLFPSFFFPLKNHSKTDSLEKTTTLSTTATNVPAPVRTRI